MSIVIPAETGLQNDESLQVEDGSLSLSTYAFLHNPERPLSGP